MLQTDKRLPTSKQVTKNDVHRKKTNQILDRQLDQQLTGPKGLYWQHKQELQRLDYKARCIEGKLVTIERRVDLLNKIQPSINSKSKNDESIRKVPWLRDYRRLPNRTTRKLFVL